MAAGHQVEGWRFGAPTERQIECLRAYVIAGSREGAAQRLGISSMTLRNHLAELRLRLGVRTSAQAVFSLMLDLADHPSRCDEPEHINCVLTLKRKSKGS
jgi:DNA-binding CsgD family transcriptional regulator